MAEHTGGCLCGAIRYTIAIDPPVQAVCHCKNCQKQAGSAYSMLVGVPAAAITITGEPRIYMDKGDSGASVTRQFCGTCGSPLFSLVEAAPGMVFVKAGTLDDTSGFKPSAQFWTKSRQDWVDLGALPGFETVPG